MKSSIGFTVSELVSYDHQIYVAVPGILPPSYRAVYEGDLDIGAICLESLTQRFDETGGFQDQAMKLVENRRLTVRPIRLSITRQRDGYDPSARELFELPLNSPSAGAGEPKSTLSH